MDLLPDKRSETVTVDQPAKHVNVSGMGEFCCLVYY